MVAEGGDCNCMCRQEGTVKTVVNKGFCDDVLIVRETVCHLKLIGRCQFYFYFSDFTLNSDKPVTLQWAASHLRGSGGG